MIEPKMHRRLSRADESTGRELVMLRDAGVCVRCHRVDPVFGVNHDHRKNRSQGGDWAPSNGQLLCGSGTTGCHGFVTTNPKAAMDEGLSVPSWADPLIWPGRRWVRDGMGVTRPIWCLYRDDGTWDQITDDNAMERMTGAGW
jgi:hypothetical protein